MTEKLKCPFCGSELRTSMLDEPVAWYCPNRCIGTYEPKVWRALITGKKAQDALIRIGKILLLDSGKPSVLTVKGKQEIKRIITSITKREE